MDSEYVLQATAAAQHGVLWRGRGNGPGVTVSAQRPAAAHGIKLSRNFASDRLGMRVGTALVAAMDYPLLRYLLAILDATGGGRAADGPDRPVVVGGCCCGLPVQTQHRLPQKE